MTDRLTPSCRRCRYWDPKDDKDVKADCVRHAPQPAVLAGDEEPFTTAVFPMTKDYQRCGEFLTGGEFLTAPETPASDKIAQALYGTNDMLDAVQSQIRGLREDLEAFVTGRILKKAR